MKNFQFSIFNFQKEDLPRSRRSFASGFSLVETLVAVGILAVAVIGTLAAAQSGISSSILSKEQVIAFYLAQEAVEEIRNIRDENALNDRGWLSGIAESSGDPCYFGNKCYVDTLSATPLTRCSNDCPRMKQDMGSGFYGYDALWNTTQYTRIVELASINEHETSVTVMISWSKGTIDREFRVRENIFDWQ